MFTFPLFRPYFFLKGACFPHAQAVHLPVLRAVRVHHCIQPVLDGPARLTLPSPAGSETPPSSAEESLAAQAVPELSAQGYLLQDKGGRVAVYRCSADGTAGALLTVTGIYTNLLPENDALRIKQGIRVHSELELDQLLEDLGE